MKIEIEITEEELTKGISEKVKAAIATKATGYTADRFIAERVSMAWSDAVDAMITEELKNSDAMRAKITQAIYLKLKGKVNALINKAGPADEPGESI